MSDNINHPKHYNDYSTNFNGQETIETWEQMGISDDACLANAIKYMDRCGKKPGVTATEDMEKAHWYLSRIPLGDLLHHEVVALANTIKFLGLFDIKRARVAMQDIINFRIRQ